jgi:hypothetical protein
VVAFGVSVKVKGPNREQAKNERYTVWCILPLDRADCVKMLLPSEQRSEGCPVANVVRLFVLIERRLNEEVTTCVSPSLRAKVCFGSYHLLCYRGRC